MGADTHQQHCFATFIRRLLALFYDFLLLFGVLVVATALVVIPYDLVTGAPFPDQGLHRLGLQLFLVAASALFFAFPWVRGGQTLGMRAWRLRLVGDDGAGIDPRDALVRLAWALVCLAPLGAGFLWMLIDRDCLALHDRLSRTRVIIVRD